MGICTLGSATWQVPFWCTFDELKFNPLRKKSSIFCCGKGYHQCLKAQLMPHISRSAISHKHKNFSYVLVNSHHILHSLLLEDDFIRFATWLDDDKSFTVYLSICHAITNLDMTIKQALFNLGSWNLIYGPRLVISNNVVCATSKTSNQSSEPLLVAWIFNNYEATDWAAFGVSRFKGGTAQARLSLHSSKCHIFGNLSHDSYVCGQKSKWRLCTGFRWYKTVGYYGIRNNFDTMQIQDPRLWKKWC